jgi:hypothetical protein
VIIRIDDMILLELYLVVADLSLSDDSDLSDLLVMSVLSFLKELVKL